MDRLTLPGLYDNIGIWWKGLCEQVSMIFTIAIFSTSFLYLLFAIFFLFFTYTKRATLLRESSRFFNKHPILQEHRNFVTSSKGIAEIYSAKKHFGF